MGVYLTKAFYERRRLRRGDPPKGDPVEWELEARDPTGTLEEQVAAWQQTANVKMVSSSLTVSHWHDPQHDRLWVTCSMSIIYIKREPKHVEREPTQPAAAAAPAEPTAPAQPRTGNIGRPPGLWD